MIIFENIDNGQTVGINREIGGKYYRAKLSALINSSNLSVNADRGQDFGWRLKPEQQATIEEWERDPQMVEKVSNFTKVMIDDLTHAEFLSYMLYQQELGKSHERSVDAIRRENQRDYEERVNKLRNSKPEQMAPFDSKVARGEATIDDFMNGDLTGDASGDKVEEETPVTEESLDDLDKVIESAGAPAIKTEAPAQDSKPKAPKKSASKK